MTLRTLNYGNYGIFLTMANAGFCPSTVWSFIRVSFRASGLGSLRQTFGLRGLGLLNLSSRLQVSLGLGFRV